jgi:hypothetical protein
MNYFYSIYAYLGSVGIHFHDDAADQNEKYRRCRNIETSIFLASIDTFLQNPGIDSIEYLVSISAHP